MQATTVRGWRRAVRVVDAAIPALVALLYIGSALDLLQDEPGPTRLAAGVLGAAAGAALTWRNDRPELVAAAVVAFGVPFHLLVPEFVVPFAALVALWAVATRRPPRISLIALAGTLGLCSLNFFATSRDDALFTIVLAIGVWALAEAARSRRAAIAEAALRAAGDEQARIARELHDVLAHSVSVIVVQAAAADDVFDTRPDHARTALRSIEDAGRDALRELRRLLQRVRPDDGVEPAAPAAPQPGLDRVDELAASVRAAGLDVTVTRDACEPMPAAGVSLSAYRIVQEALTNTLRHARATKAEVHIRHHAGALEIDVVDDGRATPATGHTSGFGLVGMRERAAVLGGRVDAGPTAHGGFRVHAWLPLDAPP
jgi:signal transduction histidine kinase